MDNLYISNSNYSGGIAQTPGPRAVRDIHSDVKNRFIGIIWIQKDNDKNIEDYFTEYDHWEKYSEELSYSKRSYQAVYKNVMKEYNNYLCILNNNGVEEYYVVAKRIRNEIELLEPFCTCTKCSACFLNPIKYIWCDHCTKCIKAGIGFARQDYIDKAKVLKQNESQKEKKNSLLQNIKWIKITEYSMLTMLLITLFYYSY